MKNWYLTLSNRTRIFTFFLALTIFGSILLSIFYSIRNYALLDKEFEQSAQTKVLSEVRQFDAGIVKLKRHLDALAGSYILQSFLQEQTQEARRYAEDLFLEDIRESEQYYQIRYIDENGWEVLRADQDKEGARIVKSGELQDKSDRYYTKESAKLHPNGYYLSEIDLNIEHQRIVIPFEPTLRISKALFLNGEYRGFLIFNVNVLSIFNELVNSAMYEVFMTNQHGKYLIHTDSYKSWSSILDTPYGLMTDFPGIPLKQFFTQRTIGEYYLYSQVINASQEPYYLYLRVKSSVLKQRHNELMKNNFLVGLFLIGASLVMAWYASRFTIQLEDTIRAQAETLAQKAREVEESNEELELQNRELSTLSHSLEMERVRYKSLMDYASDGVYIMDFDGTLLECSHQAAKMLGYSDEEMLKLKVTDWDVGIPEEELPALIKSVGGKPVTFETRHKRKDGSVYDANITAVRITVFDTPYLYASVRDITESNALKDKLAQKSQQIEEQNEQLLVYSESLAQEVESEVESRMQNIRHFQEILNSASDRISLVDKNFMYQYANQAFLNVHHMEAESLSGKPMQEIFGKEMFDNLVQPHLQQALEGKFVNFKEWFELEHEGRVYLDITLNPYHPNEAEIEGIVINVRDITGQRQTQEALDAKEQLLIQQSKMAAMGEMIGAIAHQFKQPINAIGLIAQDIGDAYTFDELSEEEMKKSIDNILKQTRFMSQTVDDFRNFFKPSKEIKPFNPKNAIDEVLHLLRPQLDKARIEYRCHAEGEFQCSGLVNEFKQVVLNIINNARDVLIERQIAHSYISIELSHDAMFGIILIKDNGGGIPKELLPNKIFEPYVSTKGEQGTGIGLQIAKTVIEKNMGGSILATNNDEGAEFMISLPLVL